MSTVYKPEFKDHYSFQDYKTWPDDVRYELIHGEAFCMSPGPTWDHQELTVEIVGQFRAFLKGKPCRAFVAPLDVFLHEDHQTPAEIDEVDTIVQPDAGIVCDRDKIMRNGIWGAPDLVLEVLSPSSVLRDLNAKKKIYESHGVREYWVLDTRAEYLLRFVRGENGLFDEGTTFKDRADITSIAFPGLVINLGELQDLIALSS